MHRLIFWGLLILVVVLIGLVIDQIFYRLIRLFLAKHVAQMIRLVMLVAVVGTITVSCYIGHKFTRVQVEVKQVEVASNKLPQSFDGYRVAQISDFHISSFDPKSDQTFFNDLVHEMKAQQPDIIVFTGDLVTIRAAEVLPHRQQLNRLATEVGVPVYSILGNHDYADYMRGFDDQRRHQDVDSLILLQEQAHWTMLNNASTFIYNNVGDSIAIVGVENIGEPPFSVYGDLNLSMQSVGGLHGADSTFTILLSHNPIHWRSEVLPQTDIDLTLSGHTHAMQLKIGNWTPSRWKYPECMGLYQEGEQYLYVNTGLGCTGPTIRIGVKPEITILTLKRKY